MKLHRLKKGFTLIEITIVLLIIIIISAISFPGFVRYRAEKQLETFVEEYYQALVYAKQTAKTMNGAIVEFTPATEGDSPFSYQYFEVKKPGVPDQTVKKVIIPESISIEGVPDTQLFEFKRNGALPNTYAQNLNFIITSSATKKFGQVTVNRNTGSIDLVYGYN